MGLIQNKVTVSQPNSHVVVKNAGGLRGLTGETGPQGPQGVPGEAATVTAGTTTTLPAGSDATVQNVGSTSAAIFNFGIPKGDKGDTGETGAAATISVGSTSTLPAGSSATVTNSGTSSAAVFDFGIPKGDKGDTGATGADGFSPTATVTKTGDTATITITDKDGTTTASISDGTTPTVNDGTLTIQKNGTTVQTFSADQASNVTANITVPTQFSELSGTVSSSQIEDEAITTGSVSGTGTNITLAGTMEGGAIESVELDGDTQQQTYSGKNLLNITKGTFTQNGITFTQNPDGSVTMNGTSTGNAYYEMNNTAASHTTITSGVRYTLSIGDVTLPSGQVIVQIRKVNPNVIYAAVNNKSASFTAPETTTTFTYIGVYGSGVTLNNVTIYPMLEVGSSMTSFEPYVGGTASPNPDYPQEVQTVTGRQVVTISGRNLLDISTFAIGGMNAGTPAAYEQYRINNANSPIPVEPNGTYTLQASLGSTIKGLRVGIHSCDANGTFVSDSGWKQLASEPYTFTVGANISYVKFVFSLSTTSDTVTTGGTENTTGGFANASEWLRGVTLQFEKGPKATPYVPYPAQYEINLGKNIVYAPDGTTSRNNVELSVSSGNVRIYNTGATSYVAFGVDNTLRNSNYGNYVAWGGTVLGAGTYTLSYTKVSGSTTTTGGGGNFLRALVYTRPIGDTGRLETIAATVELGDATNSATFTLGNDVEASVVVYLYATDATVDLTFNLQLEKGSTATTYAPYFTPIELCKIGTYQDYIYKSGEDWYVKKNTAKVTFTGAETETWSLAQAATGYFRASTASGESHADNNGYCNEFINRGSQAHGAYEYVWVQPNANAFYIQVLNTRANDVSSFKTWLSTHPATIYYDIAATDTQITNATLISELEGLLSATTYSGTTYITVSGDLASPLEVVAEADSKLAPDSVYGAAIKDGAVSVDKIEDGAVTPAKISTSAYQSGETAVGTWIDGKTIYRQVLTGTAQITANNVATVTTTIAAKSIVSTSGWYQSWKQNDTTSNKVAFGQLMGNNIYSYALIRSGNYIELGFISSVNVNSQYEVVVEYTKKD